MNGVRSKRICQCRSFELWSCYMCRPRMRAAPGTCSEHALGQALSRGQLLEGHLFADSVEARISIWSPVHEANRLMYALIDRSFGENRHAYESAAQMFCRRTWPQSWNFNELHDSQSDEWEASGTQCVSAHLHLALSLNFFWQ